MAEEVLPRWGMPEVDFIETDPEQIKSNIVRGYEKAAGISLAVGSPIYLYLLTIAAVIIQLRNDANWAAQQNLLTYAQGRNLDALGLWVDVDRLPAARSVTTFKFTLSERLASAFIIPAEFEISGGNVSFLTDKELVIPPGDLEGEVTASCSSAGTLGNHYLPGQISTIVAPMAFLQSASNVSTTIGGSEEEGDSSYAERIRMRVDGYSVAGPRLSYVYYTKSYSPAIADCAVISPEPGDVEVYCLLENGELPTQAFLSGLWEYLSDEKIRPFTDHVLCLAPEPVPYTIRVDYWINKEDREKSDSIRQAVEAAVEEYRIWQQGRIGRDITPLKLTSLVGSAGASKIDESTLEPRVFKALAQSQVAQCTGEVIVNFLGYKDI